MNLLPFDIEKVKAGAKFCHTDETRPEGYEVTKYGIIVKWSDNFPVLYLPKDFHLLRLFPEEREVWINVWLDKTSGTIFTCVWKEEGNCKNEIKSDSMKGNFTHLETIHKTYTI